MCKLCDEGVPQNHFGSRRNFLKAAMATGVAAAGLNLFAARPAQADVLVEGKKIRAVGPNLQAGGAAVIDATGRIVMPGFIDTHHHQFETALRSFLADGVLINDMSG